MTSLAFEDAPLVIGRLPAADITLPGDPQVSRLHAELHGAAGEWILVDGGLSKNGTFVNGTPISHRRRLFDGDELRLGATRLVFHRPHAAVIPHRGVSRLTPAQTSVLEELARRAAGDAAAVPPTDTAVAYALGISVGDVRRVIADICAEFGIEKLDGARARAQLIGVLRASHATGPETA